MSSAILNTIRWLCSTSTQECEKAEELNGKGSEELRKSATDCAKKALAHYESHELNDPSLLSTIHLSLAKAHITNGDFNQAIRSCNTASEYACRSYQNIL